MLSKRTIGALVLALAIVLTQVSAVRAAPLNQSGTITGTVVSVTEGTDSSGNTIIIVTFTDSSGNTQTANLSVSEAETQGLITVDPNTGAITINPIAPNQTITLDSSLVQGGGGDPCALPSDASQPVGEALANFFCGSLGVDYSTIQQWQTDGFGYGVIAQALFMAQLLGGDSALAQQILDAKQSHDFSGLDLPDGSTPTNWGQLMKDVLGTGMRSMTNLGAIMSGHATPAATETSTSTTTTTNGTTNGQGNGHGNGNGHGHGGGHGGGHGRGSGH